MRCGVRDGVFAGATDVGEAMRGPMDALATSLRSLLEQHRSDAAAAHAEQRTTIAERLESAHEVEVRRLGKPAYRERQHAARLRRRARGATAAARGDEARREPGRRAALQELRAASAQGGKANAPGVAEAQQKTRSRNLELIEEACALRVKLEGANEARRAEQQAARQAAAKQRHDLLEMARVKVLKAEAEGRARLDAKEKEIEIARADAESARAIAEMKDGELHIAKKETEKAKAALERANRKIQTLTFGGGKDGGARKPSNEAVGGGGSTRGSRRPSITAAVGPVGLFVADARAAAAAAAPPPPPPVPAAVSAVVAQPPPHASQVSIPAPPPPPAAEREAAATAAATMAAATAAAATAAAAAAAAACSPAAPGGEEGSAEEAVAAYDALVSPRPAPGLEVSAHAGRALDSLWARRRPPRRPPARAPAKRRRWRSAATAARRAAAAAAARTRPNFTMAGARAAAWCAARRKPRAASAHARRRAVAAVDSAPEGGGRRSPLRSASTPRFTSAAGSRSRPPSAGPRGRPGAAGRIGTESTAGAREPTALARAAGGDDGRRRTRCSLPPSSVSRLRMPQDRSASRWWGRRRRSVA